MYVHHPASLSSAILLPALLLFLVPPALARPVLPPHFVRIPQHSEENPLAVREHAQHNVGIAREHIYNRNLSNHVISGYQLNSGVLVNHGLLSRAQPQHRELHTRVLDHSIAGANLWHNGLPAELKGGNQHPALANGGSPPHGGGAVMHH